MELNNIERLLEAYFEGQTTLDEEATLRSYFTNQEVAPHLEAYIPLFESFEVGRGEKATNEVNLPKNNRVSIRNIAAVLIAVLIGAGALYFTRPKLTQEEQLALEVFEKSRESMMFLSERLNFGAQQLQYVNEFKEATNKVFEPVENVESK